VDIRKERPDWNVFRDGCPGGEMPAQVSDRADRLIAHLNAQDGHVALFSHGQFGCVLAARWIGLPAIEGSILRSACIAQHSRPRTQPPQGAGHSAVECRPGITVRWPIKQPAHCLITDLGAPTEPTLPKSGGLTLHKTEESSLGTAADSLQ